MENLEKLKRLIDKITALDIPKTAIAKKAKLSYDDMTNAYYGRSEINELPSYLAVLNAYKGLLKLDPEDTPTTEMALEEMNKKLDAALLILERLDNKDSL